MSDRLFLTCHICDDEIVAKQVPDNAKLAPYEVERWHLRMARHVRREHMRSSR